MTTATNTAPTTTDNLNLYEDNAGGLHLLRHSDNLVILNLESQYTGGSDKGELLAPVAAEYFGSVDASEMASDGYETRIEPDGEDAERHPPHRQVRQWRLGNLPQQNGCERQDRLRFGRLNVSTETKTPKRRGRPPGLPKPENSGRIAGEDGVMIQVNVKYPPPLAARIQAAAARAGTKQADWIRDMLENACLVSEREEIQNRIL